jgi:hypothetical protein
MMIMIVMGLGWIIKHTIMITGTGGGNAIVNTEESGTSLKADSWKSPANSAESSLTTFDPGKMRK